MEDEGIGSSDEVLQEAVRELQLDGSITVDFRISVDSFPSYIGDPYRNWWIFAVIIASVIEPVLVIDQYTTGPLGLVRAIIGLLLLGYLPGYSTVRVLFPGEQVSPLERILLSIFLSLAVSIAIGVVLGFAYLFTGITSTLGSSIYTVLMTLIAAYREYENQRK